MNEKKKNVPNTILVELRKSQNISTSKLAKILKLPERTYQNYELGISRPNVDNALKIAKYFDVTVEYLWNISAKGDDNTDTNEK